MNELNLDTFGKLVDEFLKESHIQMLIEMPEGTLDVEVKENTGGGEVVQFYILLNTIAPIFKAMNSRLELQEQELMLDSMLEMVKQECLAAIE